MTGTTERGGPPASRWRPTPRRALALVTGLGLFGVGEGLLVVAAIGNSPWTVLAEGVAGRTGLSVGVVTILIGAAVVLLWIPLRQRPGLGTVANVVLVGLAIDATVAVVPTPSHVLAAVALVLLGIAVVGLGSGLYLGAALGPGPRDGLMTGLHRRTGVSLAGVRWGIEVTVLVVGFLLGGTAGIGTVLFAFLIGPAVGVAVRTFARVPSTGL